MYEPNNNSNDLNSTSIKYLNLIPSVKNFYSDLHLEIQICIVIAIVLFTIIQCLFIRQIPIFIKIIDKKLLARSLILIGIYPVVAVAALTSILIPISIVTCDTICHLAFTFVAYQYFSLCIDYAGGETNLIKKSKDTNIFRIQTPPLCCCLICIKPTKITKQKFTILRLMVLQMPIIQCVLLAAMNIIFIENVEYYINLQMYFVPFIVASILIGVWALQITARMIAPYLFGYKLIGKYFAIQLILIICKLQPFLIQGIMHFINFHLYYPAMTQKTLNNIITQVVILVQVLCLSIWAHRLYKTPQIIS